MLKKKYGIVVPIYQKEPDIIAKTSFWSLKNNLKDETKKEVELIFIYPLEKDVAITDYIKSFDDSGFDKITGIGFDAKYFESTATYSTLLKTEDFYKKFWRFDKILIFQIDGFVVSDPFLYIDNELADIEYAGAPIVSYNSGWKRVPCVGNGGVSLRDIDTFIKLCKLAKEYEKKYNIEGRPSARDKEGYQKSEDLYFAELLYYIIGFKKLDPQSASKFCWDMNPDVIQEIYKWNEGRVPYLIHAFDRNLRYYKDACNIHGLTDNEELYIYCEKKYEEMYKHYMKDPKHPRTYGSPKEN